MQSDVSDHRTWSQDSRCTSRRRLMIETASSRSGRRVASARVVAKPRALQAQQPRQGALNHPAMASELRLILDAASQPPVGKRCGCQAQRRTQRRQRFYYYQIRCAKMELTRRAGLTDTGPGKTLRPPCGPISNSTAADVCLTSASDSLKARASATSVLSTARIVLSSRACMTLIGFTPSSMGSFPI